MAFHGVPGVSIAVIEDGVLLWAKGYGVKQAGTDDLIDTETVFSVGSVSKVGTAAITLRLVDRGQLDVDSDVNDFLRHAALHSSLQRQIDFTSSPDVVSSDFVGNRHACIVDSTATLVNGKRVVLYVWYDNEFGYACQVVHVVQKWAGISYPLIPKDVDQQGF